MTSLGRRSAVPWIRPAVPPMERARLLASRVLPTPGTSSTSTWPPASRAATTIRMGSSFPSTTRATLSTMAAPSARGPGEDAASGMVMGTGG